MIVPALQVHLNAAVVRDYLSASGDDNPIHTDEAEAVRLGLGANPVPGMLLVGLVTSHFSRVFGTDHFEAVASRFVAPMLVGAVAEIKTKIMTRYGDGSARVLRATVSTEGRLNAIVEATLPPSDAAPRGT